MSALASRFIQLYLINSIFWKRGENEQRDVDEDRDKRNRGSILEKKGTHKMI